VRTGSFSRSSVRRRRTLRCPHAPPPSFSGGKCASSASPRQGLRGAHEAGYGGDGRGTSWKRGNAGLFGHRGRPPSLSHFPREGGALRNYLTFLTWPILGPETRRNLPFWRLGSAQHLI